MENKKTDHGFTLWLHGFLWGISVFSIPFILCELVPTNILGSFVVNKDGLEVFFGSEDFSASAVLGFVGAILSAIASASLGALALWQNKRFKKENDKSQDILRVMQLKHEKERIFLIYVDFLNAVRDNFFIPECLPLVSGNTITESEKISAMLQKEKATLFHFNRTIPFFEYADKTCLPYFVNIQKKLTELTPENGDIQECLDNVNKYWKDEYPTLMGNIYELLEYLDETLLDKLETELFTSNQNKV